MNHQVHDVYTIVYASSAGTVGALEGTQTFIGLCGMVVYAVTMAQYL